MNQLHQGDNLTMAPFPDKKYSVIYADPPWDYGNKRMPVREKDAKYPSSPTAYYSTMKIDAICDLPIQDICEKDCMLFLWTTCSLLPYGFEVGKAWGFTYSTVAFNWDKQIPNAACYTLPQTELCLLFRRKGGKIPQPRGKRNIKQFISARRGKHSVKPYEVRHRITEMFPHHEKIELFARERFAGWDAWGNEV